MVACPQCRFMNPVRQKACQACGTALPYASAPNHERPVPGRPTLRGMRSPEPPSNSQSLPVARSDKPPGVTTSDQTMPSLVSPTQEQIRSHRANNTLLGHVSPASVGASPESQRGAPSSRAPVSPAPASSGSAAHLKPAVGVAPRGGVSRQPTLLGHAPLNDAPRPNSVSRSSTSQTMPSMQAVRSDTPRSPAAAESGSEEEDDPLPGAQALPAPPAGDQQRITPHDHPARTYLAVAAVSLPVTSPSSTAQVNSAPPSSPSQAYPALGSPPPLPPRASDPAPASQPKSMSQAHVTSQPTLTSGSVFPVLPTPAASELHPASPNAPPVSLGSIAPPRVSRRTVQSRLGRAVLTLTALLGGGLLLFSWLWQPATPITGQINLHDASPTLDVFCQTCSDGSHVELDGRREQFLNNRATLPLTAPPNVGVNTFALQVSRTGMGRNERVDLDVQVEYKARWDLTGLAARPPHLDVLIETAPGVSISVDDVDVALDGNHGRHSIAMTEPVHGASNSIEWLEKSVTIVTKRGTSPVTSSPFPVRAPIAPLAIDTPWSSFQTDAPSVVVSGRTSPKATVTSAESSTVADEAGYFELGVTPQLGVNAVELVASAVDHVPRAATTSFVQVSNLTPVALVYQKDAVRRFDALAERLPRESQPIAVALAGKVQEWKTHHNLTVILLSVTSGCPSRSCLVRVEYPAFVDFTPNQAVSVFGVARQPPPDVGPLPQVQSHFILH